jgi:hypothetical protein
LDTKDGKNREEKNFTMKRFVFLRSWLNAVRVIKLNKNQLGVLDSTENNKNNIHRYIMHDLRKGPTSTVRILKCMAKIHAKLGCTVSKICISKDNLLCNPLKKT